MSNEALPPAECSSPEAQRFHLGQWLGRHQALAWIASRCSSADAHALITIRGQKLYRSLGLTWQDFCSRHTGVSYKTADRIIESLEEFGDSYFNLTEILKIPTPEYRAIQSEIEDNTLVFEGQRIAINRENTEQLIQAVRALRGRLEKSRERSPIKELQAQLDRAIGALSGAVRRTEGLDHKLLVCMIDDHVSRALDLLQTLSRGETAEESDAPGDQIEAQ